MSPAFDSSSTPLICPHTFHVQLQELKELFVLYDKNGNGVLEFQVGSMQGGSFTIRFHTQMRCRGWALGPKKGNDVPLQAAECCPHLPPTFPPSRRWLCWPLLRDIIWRRSLRCSGRPPSPAAPTTPAIHLPHPSLSLQEVVVLAAAAGYDPAEVIALFKEADTNKDAVISFEEFIQLMRNSYID